MQCNSTQEKYLATAFTEVFTLADLLIKCFLNLKYLHFLFLLYIKLNTVM